MGKGNAAVKQWMSDRRRFADLYNGCLFHGNQIVQPEDLEPAESEANILVTDKDGKSQELRRHRDIVMRWKDGPTLALLACENQAKVHYAMPVRNMLYDSMAYMEQMKQLWEFCKDEKMTDEEFLSKFREKDKLCPVITIVFYYGESEWHGSRELYEMFPKTFSSKTELLKDYVANYRINLIDAGHLKELENFKTDLQEIFGMLKCRGTKTELIQYVNKNNSYFRNVDEDTYYVIREFLHSDKLWKKEIKMETGKEQINMCQALEELYNDGITEGYNNGVTAGIATGIASGKKEHLFEQIQKKLAKGKSVEDIAEALEEDVSTIQRLIEELQGTR